MAEGHKGGNTKVAFFLNLSFSILELIGGVISGSVAILSDAIHDFADSLSLGLGWYFENKSEKGSTDKYSYGYARFSLLGAMVNAFTLLLGSVYIVYRSVKEIINPQMPKVEWMIGIAILGVVLNGIAAWKLKSGKSINKQVMTIHLLEDTVGWLAVLIAGIILLFFNIPIIDPILAIIINITVLIFVLIKLVKALKILMQKVPSNVNLPQLRQKILCIDKVKEVSHLHVWTIEGEQLVITTHVKAQQATTVAELEALKRKIKQVFDDYNTEHVTVDIEAVK
jgi:cobalt-zinc-cadmium efflux system protein